MSYIDNNNIKQSNVLVIGAGGIGCELLKNLVMTGFKNITIVDLDKIEKSNLNRQFLYDKECIGKYKSEMARDTLMRLRKELCIKSYVGNIKDTSKFSYDFFKTFDVILNALDNIEARTYINKICQDLDLKLVNSGTEGYLGTVGCHIKNLTECYNCTDRTKKAKIPICSIRSKPEKIEHCIAWSKALFDLIFCNSSGDNLLSDYIIDEDYMITFNKLFNEELRKDIKEDIVTSYIDLSDYNKEFDYTNLNENIYKYDSIIFDLKDLIAILLYSCAQIKSFKYEGFDKENKDIVNFVFAAANLRAFNFNIQSISRFKAKEIAGNIIPAIASTNAIISAAQCIETIKIILKQNDNLRNLNLTNSRAIRSLSALGEKNSNCLICSTQTQCLNLELKLANFRLIDFINTFVVGHLLMNEFSINSNGRLLYEKNNDLDEEDIEDYEKISLRKLEEFNITKFSIRETKVVEIVLNNNSNLEGFEFNIIDYSKNINKDENLLGRKRKYSDNLEEVEPNKRQRTDADN
jgi:ubiquitin-like 1-activating enzyme E1 B